MACREQAANLQSIAHPHIEPKYEQVVKTQGPSSSPKVFSPQSDTRTSIRLPSSPWSMGLFRYHTLVSVQLTDDPSQNPSSYLVHTGHHRPLLAHHFHSRPGAPKISVERMLRAHRLKAITLSPHFVFGTA